MMRGKIWFPVFILNKPIRMIFKQLRIFLCRKRCKPQAGFQSFAAFDKYFEILNIKKPLAKRSFGYTTWYNYYRNINLDIVKNDLEALSKHGGFEIFQLDDGYQNAVGDWYSIDKKKFPCV